MSNPGFQVPTNLYGRHQKCTKERSTKIQDKNKRQADNAADQQSIQSYTQAAYAHGDWTRTYKFVVIKR